MQGYDKIGALSNSPLALLAGDELPLAVRAQAHVDWGLLAWNGHCPGLHSWRLARIDDEEIDQLAAFYRRLVCSVGRPSLRHQQRIVQLLRARHVQDLALIRALALPGQVIAGVATGQHSDFYQLADEQALSALLWQHRVQACGLGVALFAKAPHSNQQRLFASLRSQGHDSLILLFTARPVLLQLDSSGVRLHGASASYLYAATDMLPAATQWQVQGEIKKSCRAA